MMRDTSVSRELSTETAHTRPSRSAPHRRSASVRDAALIAGLPISGTLPPVWQTFAQSETHLSQINTLGPATSLRTSNWDLPQNVQRDSTFGDVSVAEGSVMST